MSNQEFLLKANRLKPILLKKKRYARKPMITNDGRIIFDFNDHYVGYPEIYISAKGERNDSPSLLKVRFCETAQELGEDTSNYNGWISKAWIQEEMIHIDKFPCVYPFKRRYAFRYIEISIVASSDRCSLNFTKAQIQSVTSAKKKIEPIGRTTLDKQIDRVALKTLSECMQSVFEDGPKRDRRLWLGDLRLEALTNYQTYKQNDLVKRCLYLFAGLAKSNGEIPQSVYDSPNPVGENRSMFDYSLLFIPTLLDYFEATNDIKTVNDLLPLAKKQIYLAKEYFEGDIIKDKNELGWCFLDWNLSLNKQAGAQAVYIYSEKCLISLLKKLNLNYSFYQKDVNIKSKAALEHFFDKEKGLFVSGKDKQISYASNVWCVLAGLLSSEENQLVLKRLEENEEAVKPVSPYLMHYYLEALCVSSLEDEAKDIMRSYWGKMIELGADTFFELFNPKNPDESPYGGKAVNSYCHAWSCTPSYFLRRYFKER